MRQEFLPTGPCPARLMIVGEAPGKEEVEANAPFVGASGFELDRLLKEAGLSRAQAFVTNVVRVRPANNDIEQFIQFKSNKPKGKDKRPLEQFVAQIRGAWVTQEVLEGVELLAREVELCQPKVIVAFGGAALWALTGMRGIKKWRGSILAPTLNTEALTSSPAAPATACLSMDELNSAATSLPAPSTTTSEISGNGTTVREPIVVVPTYHPAAVLRQYPLRPTVVHDLRKVARLLHGEALTTTEVEQQYTVRPTFRRAKAFFRLMRGLLCKHNEPLKLAPDIETRAGHIACIGIAWSPRAAICLPLMCVPVSGPDDDAPERGGSYWTLDQEAWILHQLFKLLTHPRVRCVGQNWLYDAQYFLRWLHFAVPQVYDTMIAQHTMWSAGQKGLDFLASLYCPRYEYWKDEGKEWGPHVPEDQLWYYNCEDCAYTYEVEEGQAQARAELTEKGWTRLPEIHAFQQSMFQPVLKMMDRGIRPNGRLKMVMAEQLMSAGEVRRQWLREVVGYELNPNSPLQMQDLFYQQLNFRKRYKRGKPGEPMTVTCDDAALEAIADSEPLIRPLIRRIQELRSIGVFLSTFVNMTLDRDGRIRCSFNIAGTVTYRFSSSKSAFGSGTNLQNVPSGEDVENGFSLPNVRELFCPDPGYTTFDIDLDSADLRVVTWESRCQEMRVWLEAGLKPYVEIAKEYLHDPTFTKSHPRYRYFKSLCHGTNYRGTAQGIAPKVGMLVHEVDRVQNWYFGKFPEIKRWHEEIEAQVRGRGWIENVFGYRCYFQDRITDKTFNEAVAWKPQSTVGNLIDRALVNIDANLPWCQLQLQVHDSLMGQYPSVMGGEATRAIVKEASIVLPFPGAPTVIPVGVKTSSSSWGECK